MDYTYKLPRGTAAAVLSFMPKAAELPGSGRWQSIGLSHHDTIFISIDESLPCDIARGYGRELCFIAFYSRAANPNISPFMRYGNSVCIPDDSSPEEIGLAYGVLYEIRKSVGTLETKLVGKSKAMQETRARIMKAVNCRFPVHIACGVGVGIDGETGFCMAQNTGQRLCVHAIGQSVGGKGVAQIVESNIRQLVFL